MPDRIGDEQVFLIAELDHLDDDCIFLVKGAPMGAAESESHQVCPEDVLCFVV
jgi:hypothetical protein